MTDPIPFIYKDTPVRSVIKDGEPWFVVSDAAKILGYRDASNAARVLRVHQQGYSEVSTPSGVQRMLVASEGGVNRLIMRSNAANAEAVQDWFTDEVLPTIRKTGGAYIAPGSQAELDLTDPDTALDKLIEVAQVAKAERARRIALEAQVAAERPMVERAKTHAGGSGLKTRQQFFREVKQWAEAEHGVTVKQDEVMAFLSTEKLGLFVRGNRSDSGQATAWAISKGYARNREDTTETGRNIITGKLTATGQEYAWERVVRYIDANGTLKLPRQIGAS